MNKFDIKSRLSEVKTPEELANLQKEYKKVKKDNQVELTVTCFHDVHFTRFMKGSHRYYNHYVDIDYTKYCFCGVWVKLPEGKYEFPETEFNSEELWIDSTIKFGGYSFYPKTKGVLFFGMNLEEYFWEYILSNNFKIYKSERFYYLCDSSYIGEKKVKGQRICSFDLINRQCVKLDKKQVDYLYGRIQIIDSNYLWLEWNRKRNEAK